MTEFETETGRAVLLCEGRTIETRYRLHLDRGKAVMIELLDRPEGIASDETVQVIFQDTRSLECRIFDDTQFCAIIGEGYRYLL